MAATFAPPHQVPTFRVLKTAWRQYIASGAAIVITVTTPPNQTVAQGTTVAGTVEVDRKSGARLPATVRVELKQGATVKATQNPAVNQTTGAFSTQFAGGTLAAGSATATVTSTNPAKSVTTTAFTVT